jgi:hypothetical protein
VSFFKKKNIAQNVAKPIFAKINAWPLLLKRLPKMWATFVHNFKQFAKVNNHPMGQKSPNLVTLEIV